MRRLAAGASTLSVHSLRGRRNGRKEGIIKRGSMDSYRYMGVPGDSSFISASRPRVERMFSLRRSGPEQGDQLDEAPQADKTLAVRLL